MENKRQEINKIKTCTTGQWSNEAKQKLVCIVKPLIELQKAYGRNLDMKLVLRGWQAILADKYTVEQIIYALGVYALERDDFPSPANINKILSPEKPKVTEAQYVNACKYQELNGYSEFSPEAYLIREYRQQNNKKQEQFIIEKDKVKNLINNSTKRIEE